MPYTLAMKTSLPAALLLLLPTFALAQNGQWHLLSPATVPGPKYDASLVYDEARDRLVLFNGIESSGASTGTLATWEFDGNNWFFRGTVGPRGPEGHVRAVYDSARNVTVAVRNANPCETWEWNGASWTLQTPQNSPGQRFGFAMAFDTLRDRTLLFGGRIGNTNLAETWEWDGTNWTLIGNGGPPGRHFHAMTYDEARDRTVLFGGWDNSIGVVYNDTWLWNGSFWQPATGGPTPAQRTNHAMTYDASRERVVMIGGRRNLGGFIEYQETWEWDGSVWNNANAPAPVPSSVAATYDSLRQRVTTYGGRFNFSNIHEDTHAYTRTSLAASWTPYGSGCPGPAGTPTLNGQLRPRIGTTATAQLTQIPFQFLNLAFGWLGYDNTQWNGVPLPASLDPFGFTGCEALLEPSGFYNLANTNGFANWSLDVPFLPVFIGQDFYLQAGVLVIGFNPGGMVFSNGLVGRIGG